GSYYETILRRFRVTHQPWGDFAREFIIGDKGAAVGLSARTKGRTYVESTVTYATKGLPLGPNDAPISIDVGRHLSDNTTVVGGFYATPQQPWGPFAGISTHSRNFSLGITASAHNVSAGFAYQSQRADVSFYTVPGVERAVGFNGVLYMPGSQLEAQSSNSSGTNDASLTLRTIRPGLNFIGGISVPSGGKPGPVAGVSIPLGHLLAVETTLRPSSSGPYGLHVGLAMGIAARRPPSAPTIPARISIDGAMPLPKMRLFVDGAPASTFAAASATANVERGTHTFAVESVDGALGSQDVALNVQAAGDSVNLTLWPERTVRGRIVVDNSASVPTDFTLAHIIVVIQPGDISVESAQDGTFFFPRQPIAPVSTIRVDAGSLPRELRPSDPLPLDGTDVELRLLPGLRIERQSFPSR
ncbi:MAG: hypothetical protein JO359_10865, partial [Candidatus Eremiobacteraeota bacterium]|nr:hypothetical protein [Candidatus Eremiobacteraeota bacterium]